MIWRLQSAMVAFIPCLYHKVQLQGEFPYNAVIGAYQSMAKCRVSQKNLLGLQRCGLVS